MHTRYKKALLVFTLGLSALSSCNDILDQKPTDVINAENAITSMSDLSKAVIGVYAIMGNTNVEFRTAGNADIIISSLLSDENYLPLENNTGRSVSTYNWAITAEDANTLGNWGNSAVSSTVANTQSNYAVIDRANRVLRVIDKIPSTPAEETLKRQLKAELLAIRGFSHFKILRSYAENYEGGSLGVPYMESINDNPADVKPSRLTVAQTFAKIEADLAAAKSLMPATFNDVTRVTAKAIPAMQSRVYLYEKKWDEAIASTTEVINSSSLAHRDQFPGIWTDANVSEVIWKLKRETGNDRIGVFYNASTSSGVVQTVDFGASLKLIKSIDKVNDVRFASYFLDTNIVRPSGKTRYIVAKYLGGNISSTPGLADIKLLRVAEMYLIRAEAYLESQSVPDNIQKATDDLNTLRRERIRNYVSIAYNNKADLLNEIYLERYRELAFEGHRYFDLRRRNMEIDRQPFASDDGSEKKKVLKPTDKAYYLPIPGFEMRANPNMVQNPIYR